MCSNEGADENTYSASLVTDLVDQTDKDHTMIREEIRRLTPRKLETERKVQQVKARLASSRKRSAASKENLARLQCQVAEVQDKCEKLVQSNEALSARIAGLTEKIVVEKKAQVDNIDQLEKLLQVLQLELTGDIFGARAMETTLASLHEEEAGFQVALADVERYVPRAEEEFESLTGRKWTPGSARLRLTAEEKATVLAIFEEEAAAFEKLLGAASAKRESLREEISRLSQKH